MASRGASALRATVLGAGLLAATGAPAPGQAPAEPLPRVTILTTGGTIASTPGDMLSGEALVAAVPELGQRARISVEELFRIGSSAMTPAHWLRLARRIQALRSGPEAPDGIVVTHGTDTMEETAFFLDQVLPPGRPVVLTGSMRPAGSLSADGPRNLVDAVRVAGASHAGDRGVVVVLDEAVHAARDVRKTHDERTSTFRSPVWGLLGRVHADTVLFRRLTETVGPPVVELEAVDSLPRVALVADYVGAPGGLVEAAAASSDGVVVVSFAGGRMSPGTREAAQRVAAGGLPVVVASREEEGRIEPGGPLLMAPGLSGAKARILLMLALVRTDDPLALRRILARY